jgi:Protein of unknown function (DUF3810)
MTDSRWARVAIGLAITALVLAEIVWARFPWSVEGGYVSGAGPVAQYLLTLLTGWVPLSVAECVEILAIGVAVAWVGRTLLSVARGPARRELLLDAALTAWIAVGGVGCLFYALWGLSYARPGADQRLGWADPGRPLAPISTAELAAVADALVDRTNEAYLVLHGWPDNGSPSAPPHGVRAVDRAIDRGYQRLVAMEGLDPSVAAPRGPSKLLGSSVLFSYLGIGGFYFPFTGEANVNALQPEWQMAHTIAHEKAHQRFVASEDEANFFGFLAGAHSEDPFADYGAWLFAQRQVLFALGERDPLGAISAIDRRLPGVQRDVDFSRQFWLSYQGPAAQVGQAVNDRYLRFNGVTGGISSYSRSLTLIVEWLRRHPETLGSASGRAGGG